MTSADIKPVTEADIIQAARKQMMLGWVDRARIFLEDGKPDEAEDLMRDAMYISRHVIGTPE